MCRRLFVHVEAAQTSAQVLHQAIMIAARTRAAVRYFYRETMRSSRTSTGGFVGSPDEWLNATRDGGDATLGRALRLSMDAGIVCDSVFSEGEPAQALAAIKGAAISWGADLLVMADAQRSCWAPTPEPDPFVAQGVETLLTALLVRTAERAETKVGVDVPVGIRFVGLDELGPTFLLSA